MNQAIKFNIEDFPILKNTIYLDSSATSLTPLPVINAINQYYKEYNANVHRGIYKISEKATKEFELARQKVASFINANYNEIIFTKNTTESLNLLAYNLTKNLQEGDEILLTQMEHHSNLVPWQQLAKEKKLKLNYVDVKNFKLDLEDFKNKLNSKTKIVSLAHISNVLGCINPIKEISKLAHENNALVVVDAAQSIPHIKIDVEDLDCDFLAFSGHKLFGPTGIGVLYGKERLLENLPPFLYGGEMIKSVGFNETTFNDLPHKFEAGTPPIAQAIGLGKAIEYLQSLGNIEEYENYLTNYTLEKLKTIPGIKIYSSGESSVISFNLENIHAHDVSAILDRENIAIRAGHMCAMPLVKEVLKTQAVCRVSLSFYNTTEEIDKLITALKKVKEVFQ
tara:strand:- start:513 stop:1697 length:1185 start_codon:yes stop_codon:yes gene_type:complete